MARSDPTSVLLDRSFAFYLLQFMNADEAGPRHEGADRATAEAANGIVWAAILFDKILIEDHYGTALARYARPRPWFWSVFQTYSPESTLLAEPDRAEAIRRSVQAALSDRAVTRIVKQHLPRTYWSEDSRRSLLLNVWKTIHLSQAINAAIFPAPDKAPLYQHFLPAQPDANDALAGTGAPANDTVRELFSLEAPAFDTSSVERLLEARGDSRIQDLRRFVWERSVNGAPSSTPGRQRQRTLQEELRDELRDIKNQLVLHLLPSLGQEALKVALTSLVPFPASLAAEAAAHAADQVALRRFRWLLFLVELQQSGNSRDV